MRSGPACQAAFRLTSVCSWRARDLGKTFICVAAEGSPAAETRSVRRQRGEEFKMRSRAYRRYQLERLKKRVAKYYGGYAANNPRHLGRLAATRTPCSCWMCRNPRRNGYVTLQELKVTAAV